MIRNVKDNAKRENPYTTNTSNIRMGKFYSNKLNDAHAKSMGDKVDELKSSLSDLTNRLRP